MSNFTGFINFKKDIKEFENIIKNMNSTLLPMKIDENKYYINDNIALAHNSKKYSYSEYSISCDGEIYNIDELKNTLKENGFEILNDTTTEILLKSFIHFGKDVVTHLNGAFAFVIWNSKTSELFYARDHLGVKPLFYTIFDNTLIFSSRIKALFEYPGVEKVIDKQGISELFGIGPAHTPGTTVFKNIFELEPAHFAIYNKSRIIY